MAVDQRPLSVWRHARAIVLLPGVAAILVPAAILFADGSDIGWGLDGLLAIPLLLLGIALIAAGLALWVWTVRLFARIGEGTLAPWDPTRHLVVEGAYRHARYPMITAVLALLLGEALLFGSMPLSIWCAAFFAFNHTYFLVYEERDLERRFGEEYRTYKGNVPRWVPARAPWAPG
jgi:protein-S-isoprenylcysteine O-methyltransferase Ste14